MKRNAIVFAVLFNLFCLVIVLAQTPAPTMTTSPFLGQWKLNLEKTTYTPGPKPTTIQTYSFSSRPDGFIVGLNGGYNAQGVLINFNETVSKYDGKDYPTFGTQSLADFLATGKKSPTTNAVKPIDARTVEIIGKTDGKVTNPNITRIRQISPDGKTMTDTSKGIDAQGRMVNNVQVYDRAQ